MWTPNNEPMDEDFSVTTSDVTVYAPPIEVLYVGTGGDVSVLLFNSDAATIYKNVPSGQEICRKISKVMSTSTNASDLVGSRRKKVVS